MSDHPHSKPTHEPSALATLHEVESQIEARLSEAVAQAERSLAQRFGAGCVRYIRLTLRGLGYATLLAYFIFGIAILLTRYSVLPHIESHRTWIETKAAHALGAEVHIGRIEADWNGLNPRLKLTDLRLRAHNAHQSPEGLAPVLVLPQTEATLSWSSLWHLSPRFAKLSVLAPELEVRHLADGRWQIGGFTLNPSVTAHSGGNLKALEWILGQKNVAVHDARVLLVDETKLDALGQTQTIQLEDVQFQAQASWLTNRFALRATPPSELATTLDLRASVRHPWFKPTNRLAQWSGELYAQTDFIDLGQLESLTPWSPKGMRLNTAQGAARLWLRFAPQRLERVISDLALANVDMQLGADLAPLRLDSLRGRLSFQNIDTVLNKGHELVLEDFSMNGRAVAHTAAEIPVVLPPTRLRLQWFEPSIHRPARGAFDASLISLNQLSALAAHVPLGSAIHALIAQHAVQGELKQLSAQWEGDFGFDPTRHTLTHWPAHYRVRTQFSKLGTIAVAADPLMDAHGHARVGTPGFENLSGELDINHTGGIARIRARNATMDFPGLFMQPRKQFTNIEGGVQWLRAPNRSAPSTPLEIRFNSLVLTNDDMDATVEGTYQAVPHSPGLIDLNARIRRVQANQIHQYLPLRVHEKTRHWLREALRSGIGTQGTVRLRGNLSDFPFTHGRSGEFRVYTRVHDATLDFAPHLRDLPDGPRWPELHDIDAGFVIEGSRMHITGHRANAKNIKLSQIDALIDDLGAKDKTHLMIRGKLTGPLADMLKVVEASPVNPLLGYFFSNAKASGETQTTLELDIPLGSHDQRVRVAGSLMLNDQDLHFERLPPFTRARGQVHFTDRGLQLRDIRAGFLGGQVQLHAQTHANGAIVFKGNGHATPEGVQTLTDIVPVQQILSQAHGSAQYSATVQLRQGRPDIRVTSNLVGWQLSLPAPMTKQAHTPMPVRVSMTPFGTQIAQDRIDVAIGSSFLLRYERDGQGLSKSRIMRGAIRISDTPVKDPLVLPQSGIRADLTLDTLDFDRWRNILSLPTPQRHSMNPLIPQSDSKRRAGGDGSGLPDWVTAHVRQLSIAGKPIDHVVLGATRVAMGPNAGDWQINVHAKQANGALLVRLSDEHTDARITARLARLTIPEAQRDGFGELLDAPTNMAMPGFDVVADHFELGDLKLGRLELIADNTLHSAGASMSDPVKDWDLKKLEITNPDGSLSAKGRWARPAESLAAVLGARVNPNQTSRRMALELVIAFSDGGALLHRLGIPDAMRATHGTLEGQVSWQGSPFSIDIPTLSGALTLNAQKGQFLKAEAGVGRLLGVASLQSIPKRLALDFRDIFSKGFAFDTLQTNAKIHNGVLHTENFRMQSVAATVMMEGEVDLSKETQQLHVLVLPEINAGSASLLYAALANPAVGIGTFLAQVILRDPLSKAFSFEYDISGSWADPQVKRRPKPTVDESQTLP